MNNNPVSPKHYSQLTPEPIEIAAGMPFELGNVWKYLCRAGHKAGQPAALDLAKAEWYLDRYADTAGAYAATRGLQRMLHLFEAGNPSPAKRVLEIRTRVRQLIDHVNERSGR